MITLISGTNRISSLTEKFARQYYQLLLEDYSDLKWLDLKNLPVEILSADVYDHPNKPEPILQLQNSFFRDTNSFIFIFPEYNGTYPGILKLLIDSLEPKPAFAGKKASMVGVSSGRAGNLRGLDQFGSVLQHMGVTVLPNSIPVSRAQLEFEGDVLKPDTEKLVRNHISRSLRFFAT